MAAREQDLPAEAARLARTHCRRGGLQDGVTTTEPFWKRRWTIIALCFVAFMLCNMDRVNMSIAILPMSIQYGWDSQTIGLVQSSFFWCASMMPTFPPSAPKNFQLRT